VLLLREDGGEIQVLMTRRHAELKFMGGMWVFPGGALSEADASAAALAHIPAGNRSASCERLENPRGERLTLQECQALIVAACRETFEETGVLLAQRLDGTPCDRAVVERLQAERQAVATNAQSFAAMLEREQLRLDIGRLIYWAHWITPSAIPRRFDTRFYAIAAPPSQVATPDLTEASDLLWMSPATLLERARSGAMPIARPTLFNLEDLQASIRRHSSLDALFAAEAARSVLPILPKAFNENGQTILLMPWNEEYAAMPGEGVSLLGRCPEAFRNLPSKTTRD
jgi:8-oxo-dGTP pyrophosphatase MutT (NUDIX family)